MCLTIVDGAHNEILCFNFHKSSHENVSMLWAKASSHVSRECVSGFYLRVNLCDFYICKEQNLWSLIFIFLFSFLTSALCTKMLILGQAADILAPGDDSLMGL